MSAQPHLKFSGFYLELLLNFNVALTNDVVSFEQPVPDCRPG